MKTTRSALILAQVWALLLLAAPAVARAESETLARIRQRDRLIVGNNLVFPTFNSKNPATGQCEGFMADLARALANRLLGDEKKLEFHPTEEATRLDDVSHGIVDLLIDTIPISDEKAKLVGFSDESFRSGSALLVKRGSPITGLGDIKQGTRIAWVSANPDVKFIREKAPDATYLEFEKSAEAVAALRDGRADAFTQVVTHLYRAASQNPGYEVVGRFTTKPYAIVLQKGDTELRETLNAFLKSLRASGEYDRLFVKWFGPYAGAGAR